MDWSIKPRKCEKNEAPRCDWPVAGVDVEDSCGARHGTSTTLNFKLLQKIETIDFPLTQP